jgi:REP element-mobilizing transposase RayT
MARPLRIQYPGAFYHITSRGNDRNSVYKNDRDREKFLSYLESATSRYGAAIHAYCLMGNHYHLLLETPRGNLPEIMRHINGAYTTYFNVKRDRSGHLFQGRYKAILIDADEYAKELSRYIHLNPVRVGAVKKPEAYRWSSYRAYIGENDDPQWLTTDFIVGYFGKKVGPAQRKYRAFVEEMVGKEEESPLREAVLSTILGSKEFVREISRKYLRGRRSDRNVPALKELSEDISIEAVAETVAGMFGKDEKSAKKASIYLCHRYTGKSLKTIGGYFGMSESGVSQASRRFQKAMEQDRKLRKSVERAKKRAGL